MYHRVAVPRLDPFGLCVSPERFADQIAALRARYPVLGPEELAAAVCGGRLPRRAVALTFDDGYVDLLARVAPVLARHRVPATAFVSVESLGAPSGFWWDELARLLLDGSTERPLTVRIDDRTFAWPAGVNAASRIDAYYEIHALLRPRSDAARNAALSALRAQRGGAPASSDEDRALGADEVRALAATGWVGIGAHSMTHPPLSARSEDVQRWEIRESKERLEAIAGTRVDTFAYPHGDLGRETPALVADCGFRLAFSAAPGVVRRRADPYRLPRFAVPNCRGDELCRRIDAWFAERPAEG